MNFVVPKLQSLILLVTRRVVLLLHCFVPNVLISPKNSIITSKIILLKNTAAQNLSLLLSKNFVSKSFQYFTLDDNIKTPSMAAKVDTDDTINEVDDTNLKEEIRSCPQFLVDSEPERARHKIFNYALEKLNSKTMVEKPDHLFNNSKCAAK